MFFLTTDNFGCRLGFLIDFLSHAAIVGFMAGAAIVIGLQQLKSLLGISHFTTKTDVVSVLDAVIKSFHTSVRICFNLLIIICYFSSRLMNNMDIFFLSLQLYPLNFVIGCSFLIFILITRFIVSIYSKINQSFIGHNWITFWSLDD